MKTLWVFILVLLSPLAGWSQPGWSGLNFDPMPPGSPALIRDPVFNQVLIRRITYPASAIRSGGHGRVYAGFDIDPLGHIQNVTILGTDTDAGFGVEVRNALKRMPPLNPRYAGRYALPVVFVYINGYDSVELHPAVRPLSEELLANRQLLSELVFQGRMQRADTYSQPAHHIIYY